MGVDCWVAFHALDIPCVNNLTGLLGWSRNSVSKVRVKLLGCRFSGGGYVGQSNVVAAVFFGFVEHGVGCGDEVTRSAEFFWSPPGDSEAGGHGDFDAVGVKF